MEKFENTHNRKWVISPKSAPPIMEKHTYCIATGGVVAMVGADENGVVTIHLAYNDTSREYD